MYHKQSNILSANSWFHLHLLNFLFVYQFQSKMTIKIWNSIWTIPFTIKKVCYLKENMQLLPIPFTGTAKWHLKLIVWVANWATATVVFASWARFEHVNELEFEVSRMYVDETSQYCNISHFCRYCLELVSREWNIAFLTSRIDWLKNMKWKKRGKKKFVKTFLAKHTYYVRISWSTKFNILSEIYI